MFPGIFTTNQKDRYSDRTTVEPLLRFLSYDPSRGFEYTLFSVNASSKTLSTRAFVSYFTFYSLSVVFSLLAPYLRVSHWLKNLAPFLFARPLVLSALITMQHDF